MDRSMIGALVVAGLAVLAAFNSYSTSRQLAERPDPYRIAAAERRFAGAMELLPQAAIIGYISDMPVGDSAGSIAYMSAQYGLAPHPLIPVERSAGEWAIGNFARPGDFAAFGARLGLTLVRDFGEGVVVYQRSKP
jgi:hypothetical protein